MPRSAKLRKKNGYWMTKAGGSERYFGHVSDVPFKEARKQFSEFLKSLTSAGPRRAPVSCLEVCDQHLEWVQKHRSDALYRQRKHFLDRWCDFEVLRSDKPVMIRDLAYTQVDADDLESWLASLEETLGQTSRRSAQTAVKACWNWAAKDRHGPLPPDFRPFLDMAKVDIDSKELTEVDLLTGAEVKRLFKMADYDLGRIRGTNGRYQRRTKQQQRKGNENPYRGFEDLLRCYYYTGARTSELAQARVKNVLTQSRLVLLATHKRSKTLGERKKTTRRIALNSEAFTIFERNCHGKSAEEYVFQRSNGKPWNRDCLNDRFAKVRKLAKARDTITIYDFRHLWISEALMNGIDIATVAKMAGTSIDMVEKVYGHFSSDHFAEAQRKLDLGRKRRKAKTLA